MSWKDRIRPIISKIEPYARVADRVAQVAVHLQKPTIPGVLAASGTALSAIADQLDDTAPGWTVNTFLSPTHIVEAVHAAGINTKTTQYKNGSKTTTFFIGDAAYWCASDGSLTVYHKEAFEPLEALRKVLDRSLPNVLFVRPLPQSSDFQPKRVEARPAELTTLDNPQAHDILRMTLPLLEGGRCILLDGKPGVGKTTCAQIIAREAKLGRTVILDSHVVGYDRESASSRAGDIRDALRLLSAGVLIVDDVDKVILTLDAMEALRANARLVVLTANNGNYDEVLDAATVRAGRVDEVFELRPAKRVRAAPFDRLSEAEWEEIAEWPVAYLNEVEKRLNVGREPRLEDLRQRLGRRTRSGKMLG